MDNKKLTKKDLIDRKNEVVETIRTLIADYITLVNENKEISHNSALIFMNFEEKDTEHEVKQGEQFNALITLMFKNTGDGFPTLFDNVFSKSPQLFKMFETAVINQLNKTFTPEKAKLIKNGLNKHK